MALAFGLSKWWFHRTYYYTVNSLETRKSINSNRSVIEERASKTEKQITVSI